MVDGVLRSKVKKSMISHHTGFAYREESQLAVGVARRQVVFIDGLERVGRAVAVVARGSSSLGP